ncbi:hypothetical protein [Mesorhizobium sp. WSM4887]|uniref:hypothetical protein n=1 Tax=Mesorhizobium sp. WSM4887 TaxID=3038543 RepID=UPI0024177D8B|nr:hypothetical protein [Mesorhizobium sp. WSM4887]MDG4889279.1 hypothetical protein [Mesorhizobium sp. WSM4887]
MRSADQRREADRIRKQEQREREEAGVILLNLAMNRQHISQLLLNLKKIPPELANDKKALAEATADLLATLKAVDIVTE